MRLTCEKFVEIKPEPAESRAPGEFTTPPTFMRQWSRSHSGAALAALTTANRSTAA